MPGVRSVTVMPGWTTVTLMPAGPSSSARFLVRAATATLRTEPKVAARLAGGQAADVDDAAPALAGHVRSRDRAAVRR